MKTESHMFMPGDTIVAVIKKYNCYTSDEQMLNLLHSHFIDMNGDGVFRPGMRVDVPVLVEPEQPDLEVSHLDIPKEHQ